MSGIPCTNPNESTTIQGGIDLTFNSSGDAVLQCIYAEGGGHSAGSAANLGTLDCGTSVQPAGVTAIGSVSWFTVTSICSTGVSFSLTGPVGDQFDLYSSPSSGALVSGVTSASQPAGTYYIKIYGTSPTVIGEYTIALQS